jgi:segregation and condensation protein B
VGVQVESDGEGQVNVDSQAAAGDEPGAQPRLTLLLESLLFVADGPVPLTKLAKTVGVGRQELEEALTLLGADYAGRGLRLQRLDGRVQMVTAPEATPYVESFLGLAGEGRLSAAALETLAIIAYRQPLSRAGIEAVRGVNCDRVLASLQARGLVAEVGRAETVGRPVLFGTTFAFLETFGLTDLAELPPLAEGAAAASGLKGE